MGRNVATIADVCEPAELCDPRRDPASEFHYVDISGIDRTCKAIAEHQTLLGADAPSRARKAIRKGDILVSTVRPNLNAVAMVPACLDGHIASTGFCVLRPDRAVVEPRYLFYRTITPGFVAALTAQVRGASYPAVSDKDVRQVEILLPPLAEQRRIVEILDQADNLRRLRAEADAKADRILPSLFVRMFGDPATKSDAMAGQADQRNVRCRFGGDAQDGTPGVLGRRNPMGNPEGSVGARWLVPRSHGAHADRGRLGKLLCRDGARELGSSLFQGADRARRGRRCPDVHQPGIQEPHLRTRRRSLVSVRLVQDPHDIPAIARPPRSRNLEADRRIDRIAPATHAEAAPLPVEADESDIHSSSADTIRTSHCRSLRRPCSAGRFPAASQLPGAKLIRTRFFRRWSRRPAESLISDGRR